jgi:hypothetical protein
LSNLTTHPDRFLFDVGKTRPILPSLDDLPRRLCVMSKWSTAYTFVARKQIFNKLSFYSGRQLTTLAH